MNQHQTNKLRRFLNDKDLNETVYAVLLESFISKTKDANSVEEKAACWIAIQRLNDAWREMDRYNAEDSDKNSQLGQQPGL